jgi:hypothetical protein
MIAARIAVLCLGAEHAIMAAVKCTAVRIAALVAAGVACNLAIGQEVISAPLALQKAAERLEQLYAVPVTYEEPFRIWSGEVESIGGQRSDGYEIGRIPTHTLTMPADLIVGSSLNLAQMTELVRAYSDRNPNEPRFRVEQSKAGFHIIPSESHDAQGRLVPAPDPLSAEITVPRASRTASEHLRALFSAVESAVKTPMILIDDYFNQAYVANDYYVPRVQQLPQAARPYMVFEWGAERLQARVALIDLLAGSRTTLTWRLKCSPYLNTPTCYFTPGPLQVGPRRMVMSYDRCKNCQSMPIER